MNKVLKLLLVLMLFLLFLPHAMAATVTVQPLYDWLNQGLQELLEGIAMGVSGWIMYIFHKYLTPWIGAQLEAKARESLNTALANGVAIALHKIDVTEQANNTVVVNGQVAAWAAQYAIDHAPTAVAKFGLDPNALALKALAYVPPVPTSVDTTGVSVPKPELVTSASLPDIKP